jgi:hypothetical protein
LVDARVRLLLPQDVETAVKDYPFSNAQDPCIADEKMSSVLRLLFSVPIWTESALETIDVVPALTTTDDKAFISISKAVSTLIVIVLARAW